MKKPFLTYYNDEYRFLVEAGKEFAKNQPVRAQKLNITGADKDPNVERLFEGFAFLTAKIRARLDDELPQFTDGVMGLLWPHFLRPIPALAMLKFAPRDNLIREAQTIERGAEVLSQPVGPQKTACKFRTCWPVRLLPLKLEKVDLSPTRQGKHVITFRFQLAKGAKYEKVFAPPAKPAGNETPAGDDRIRLFLHSDPPMTASLLFLFLTYYVEKTVIKPANQNAPVCEIPEQAGVAPAGFAKDENLWPDSAHTLAGYRLLQEYFAFPQKFRFIDLQGLSRFTPPAEMDAFEVQVFLRKNFREDLRFSAENFNLFCAPIVNLYSESMYSIKLNQLRPEYPATPYTTAEQVEVYSVDTVTGEDKIRKKHVYLPFNSFRHVSNAGPQTGQPRFYKAFSRRDPNNRWETVLAFGGHELQNSGFPEETVSLTATCMDGALPSKEVRPKFISIRSKNFKSEIPFFNLEQPTPPIYPPQQEDLQWRLLSHMALNFVSLADRGALQELLELYNWPRDEISYEANRRRIQGIREITAAPDQYVMNRAAIRGTHLTIKLEEDHFNFDHGDLYLFGLLLSEALAHFATINSFVRLTVIAEPSGVNFVWPPRLEKGIPTL